MDMANQPTSQDEIKKQVCIETAQAGKHKIAREIFNDIKVLTSNREGVRTRWIWELLQNALDTLADPKPSLNTLDTSADPKPSLIVSLEYEKGKISSGHDGTKKHDPGKISFRHNGAKFKSKEIVDLICSVSTKTEDDRAIGQYGSGFLTTHLLSPIVNVSGQLDDDQSFKFCLKREVDSVEKLRASIAKALEDFGDFVRKAPTREDGFTTEFQYPIEDDAVDVVEEGLKALKKCAPFVLVFNKCFKRIEIKSDIKSFDEITFEVGNPESLPEGRFQKVTVIENKNGNQKDRTYLLAEKAKTSVAIPLKSESDNQEVCLPVGDLPRLFLGFPLVHTEKFRFPVIINSFDFTSTPGRDGVYLGKNKEDEANRKNEDAISDACDLLISLLKFTASPGWCNTHVLATIPAIDEKYYWLKREGLKENPEKSLIEKILKSHVVIDKVGKPRAPKDLIFPLVETDTGAETDTGVEALWDLLDGLEEMREKLPKRDETAGWSRAIKSWKSIYESNESIPDGESLNFDKEIVEFYGKKSICDGESFNFDKEIDSNRCFTRNPDGKSFNFDKEIDGLKLASYIDQKTSPKTKTSPGSIKDLGNLLQDNIPAIEWLDKLHDFFNENKLREKVKDYRIVPNQDEGLDKLSNLHRDQGIDEELKVIAELLEWDIRQKLRHKELHSLTDEVGAEDGDEGWDNKYVVEELLTRINDKNKLLTLINDKNKIEDKDFKKAKDFKDAIVHLFTWIVHKEYWDKLERYPVFTKETAPGKNKTLYLSKHTKDNEQPLAPDKAWPEDLREYSDLFPPDYILAWDDFFKELDLGAWKKLDEEGFVKTDVIVTKKVTKVKFDKFLIEAKEPLGTKHEITEEITVTNIALLSKIMSRVSQKPERARLFWRFLTKWLVMRDSDGLEFDETSCKCGKSHRYFPAEWLAPLAEKKWVPLGGKKSDIATEKSLANLFKGKEEELFIIEEPKIVKLLEAINVNPRNLKMEIIKEIATEADLDLNIALAGIGRDLNLRDCLEQIRTEQENRRLGRLVEQLVKESLEEKDFLVKLTGAGSDFKISPKTGKDKQSWLVEVKSTRGRKAKMTYTQAKTAVDQKNRFLLCVVPVKNAKPDLDAVRNNMLFVENIGGLVAPLYENIDEPDKPRLEITTPDKSPGVQLEVLRDAVRICVDSSVWKKHGFRLESLAERLAG